MDKEKIYFPNLNGLRFIAACLVIIHHIEQFKWIFKLNSYWGIIPCIVIIGKLGVVLFFVLSGFLITHLLLVEESIFNRISIRKFYVRRILRIWPLYFLIIILALIILPNISVFTWPGFEKDFVYKDLFLKIILYLLFLPNLVFAILGIVPYASHTWSIGTEEQFYLAWPIILKVFKKYRVLLMMFIVVAYLLVAIALHTHYTNFIPYKQGIIAFWKSFNIDCMAIGGFYAILLFQNSSFLKIFMNNYLFYFTIITVSAFMIMGVEIPYVHNELYALLFGVIILNFAANKKITISLENKFLNYLGKISYGLYMYHPIGIVLSLYLVISLGCITNWLIYPLSIILTIILAAISFRYFESVFLNFKSKFSNIISGSETKK